MTEKFRRLYFVIVFALVFYVVGAGFDFSGRCCTFE